MKLVCLQHLIEHDRLIDHSQEYFDELRVELKQLWTTYSTFVDEMKLRLEYEQKLKNHQKLIQDVTNLWESNSNDIERYRITIDKLRQYIEQERLFSEDCLELEVKSEPIEDVETIEKLDSMDFDMTIQTHRFTSDNSLRKQKPFKENSIDYDPTIENTIEESVKNPSNQARLTGRFASQCPFWRDGAFGLTKESHGMYLCIQGKCYQSIFDHLFKFHRFTLATAEKLRHAITNNQDPSKTKLFRPDESVIDRISYIFCPFSDNNPSPMKTIKSSIKRCRSRKPHARYELRTHLMNAHRMGILKADKLICKLEMSTKQSTK
ncbi:unnamed protein product [Adineta ricciae]|uniref:Uncharacterized protein n=1 Tax=Adineta ricciae TaxID=249248 RepID=A0A816EKE5_ADIRI|nr:unnamed protein product [Adineta ricciae]